MDCRKTNNKREPCKVKTKPHHEVTEFSKGEVASLASFGNTRPEIAAYMNICEETLLKHYREILETAAVRANSKVAKGLFKKAVEDEDLQAQIFWLKTRARWRTADSEAQVEESSKIKEELKRIMAELDAKNKKEY